MATRFKWIFTALLLIPTTLLANNIIRYDITGLHGEILKNALAALKNAEVAAEKRNKTLTLNKQIITHLFSQGNNTIEHAMQPFGYFAPSIHASLEQSNANYIFHYQINPGPSLTINQLKIQLTGAGKNDAIFKKWLANFPLHKGQIFDLQELQNAKRSFFTVANDNGYIKAKLEQHKTSINLANYNAVIELHFVTGKQYFYGPIRFSQVALKDSFLRRFVKIKSGEPYSFRDILKLQQDLTSSGYFKSVTVNPHVNKMTTQQIPLNVKLKLQNKMRYLIGAGYGTDTGYRGRIGWQWRRVNSSGHHLDMQYNVSQIGNGLGINYFIPGHDPLNEQYHLNVNSNYYKTDIGKSHIRSTGIIYSKNKNLWQTNYSITYQYEKYELKGQQETLAWLLMPSVTWTYLKTNDILQPNYGLRFSLNLRGAVKDAISDITFAQYRIRLRYLIPLSENNRLLTRLDVGATYASDSNKVPLSLRFTAGGTQSVRSYAYQSIGPGNYLFSNSIEYQHRIKGNWYAAIFHDMGSAFDSFHHANLRRSAGIGAVWQSPIGTIELALAKSTSEPHKGLTLEFSIGTLL